MGRRAGSPAAGAPRALRRSCARVLVAGLLASAALPQSSKPPEPPPAVDPYTRGEPARLERLGYRSFGPFRFGPATTETVQSLLGDLPMLWVETAHFRLGSSLGACKVTEPAELEELKRELEDLRADLERVPKKPKELDPWLRLHLNARRLERLHADFRARFGLDGAAPAGAAPPLALSMPEKLTVLLTEKKSTLARFTRELCGAERGDSMLHHFQEQGALFYGLSAEALPGADSDLHYALAYGVAQNLLFALNGYPRLPPAWWTSGLALWFAREREPRVLLYSRPANEELPPEELADWPPLVRGRVTAGACLPWSDMLARPSWLDQAFGDNVVLWSRLDFLVRREGVLPRLAALLHATGEPPDSARALATATGLELDALDAAWRAWVLETYPKKRK